MNLSASWWKTSHDTGRTASGTVDTCRNLHVKRNIDRYIFLELVQVTFDIIGLFSESFALGFFSVTLVGLIGIGCRSVKVIFSGAAGQPLD